MENKKWLVGLIAFVIIVVVAIIGFSKMGSQNKTGDENKAVSGAVAENYFDDSAKVMYFYSDGCSYCVKQKEILQKLGEEGYRVRSMDVGQNPNYWADYKLDGTPTFIAENGEPLIGLQTYEELKPWLDAHK